MSIYSEQNVKNNMEDFLTRMQAVFVRDANCVRQPEFDSLVDEERS